MVIVGFSTALIFLGALCGAALLAAGMGWGAASASFTLLAAFPLFAIGGFAVLAIEAHHSAVRRISQVAALVLLALALLAALALVLTAIGFVPHAATDTDTWSLWYVLIVASLIGIPGTAAFRQPAAPAPQD